VDRLICAVYWKGRRDETIQKGSPMLVSAAKSNPDCQKMLARIREQRRAADRADAYLLLQQTIQADLAVRGELGPDEFVELVRTEEGTVLARVTDNTE
jgi:hypothetical protein